MDPDRFIAVSVIKGTDLPEPPEDIELIDYPIIVDLF